MAVIPIGLGTRLRRRPLVTLLIIAAWVAEAVLGAENSRERDESYLRAANTSGLVTAQRQLFQEQCRLSDFSAKICSEDAVLILTGQRQEKSRPSLDSMRTELRSAEKVRDRLADCTDSPACHAEKRMIFEFGQNVEKNPSALAGLPSHPQWVAARERFGREVTQLCREHHCLVAGNFNLKSLLLAQFQHSGLNHLLGNTLAFLAFGIFVEQRFPRLIYLLLLLVGGSLGMTASVLFETGGQRILLGGSAMVTTTLGLFFAAFFKANLRLWVFIPFRWEIFNAPVKYTLPYLILLQDVVGMMDSGFAELRSDPVAHVAHLGGMAFGILAGALLVLLNRLPREFLYPLEVQDFRRLRGEKRIRQKLQLANAMIEVNPDNSIAMSEALSDASAWLQHTPPQAEPATWMLAKRFVERHGPPFCAMRTRQGEFQGPLTLVARMPHQIPLERFLGSLGHQTILRMADVALAKGMVLEALRLYDLFFHQFHYSEKAPQVVATVRSILSALPPHPSTLTLLRAFEALQPHPILAREVRMLLTAIDSQEGAHGLTG